MKRVFSTFCAALLVLCFASGTTNAVTVDAGSAYFGRAAADGTDVHTGASAENRKALELDGYEEFLILEEKTNAAGEDWVKIRTSEVTGWILENEVKPVGIEALEVLPIKDTVTRYEPSEDGEIKFALPQWHTLFVNQKETSDGTRWVEANNNLSYEKTEGAQYSNGWIKLEDLTLPKEKTAFKSMIIAKSAAVYKDAFLSSQTGVLNYETPVTIKAQYFPFPDPARYKIQYRENGELREGWVNYTSVKTEDAHEPVLIKEFSNGAVIREGASNSYPAAGKLKAGMLAEPIGQFYDGSEFWLRLQLSDGKAGWIRSAEL
ncbi:hypothetical protein GKZ89_17620 [Bacillus mangrovi]|uniref:SH3b domain-containing protein n=1 Tax=Metabacillus mangrovi TaxID=1491830 RepID=A0A7X2S9P1_9BACI|nr:hypothetical protein [Metabacillus mangrovi]MTH55221.1 hypothetical protein [Metabacillus mangrovi]